MQRFLKIPADRTVKYQMKFDVDECCEVMHMGRILLIL